MPIAIAPIGSGLAAPGAIRGMSPGEIAVMGVGSVLLVCGALSIPVFARLLGSRAGRFLGRVSYASYLLHRPLLTVLAPLVLVPTLLAGGLIEVKGVTLASALGLIAIVVAGSLLLSIPFHRWVEQPAIALGRRLSRAIAARRGVAG